MMRSNDIFQILDIISEAASYTLKQLTAEAQNEKEDHHIIWNYIYRIKYLMWLDGWAALVWLCVEWFFRFVEISCVCRAVSDICQAKLIQVEWFHSVSTHAPFFFMP